MEVPAAGIGHASLRLRHDAIGFVAGDFIDDTGPDDEIDFLAPTVQDRL